MRRNPELIRSIGLAIEAADGYLVASELAIPGFGEDAIVYHCNLLLDSGFIVAVDIGTRACAGDLQIERLTSAGHDFVDAARNPEVFQKALAKIGPTVQSVGLDVLVQVLGQVAINVMGIG